MHWLTKYTNKECPSTQYTMIASTIVTTGAVPTGMPVPLAHAPVGTKCQC